MKNRVLALLLTLVMVLSLIPTVAMAATRSSDDLTLQITHISLDPANDALGYKAELIGDDVVKAHVKSIDSRILVVISSIWVIA